MKFFKVPLLLAVCLVSGLPAQNSSTPLFKLPKYQTPIPGSSSRIWHFTQNLGPTGARGWMSGAKGDTLKSREILVKSVEPGSPSDGILQPYDVIVGARFHDKSAPSTWQTVPSLKPFENDARMSFARAITWAESEQGAGRLELLVSREGQVNAAVIPLRVMGNYADAAPLFCSKSHAVAKGAADFVAKTMPAYGYSVDVGEPKAALLMLGMGDAAYLDHVRRTAMNASLNHTVSISGKDSWRWGNTAVFLCEYYLATGDDRVLPAIQDFTKHIADAQYNPGTWGHTTVKNFVPPGYGSVNATAVTCFLALVMAEHIGLQDELINGYNKTNTVDNSIRFFGSFAGLGSPPYGDHMVNSNPSGSGKSGPLVVAFNLLGSERITNWYAQLCASVSQELFEAGHSGNYFNQVWTPLGASFAGSENYASFWARFHSYRDLARRHDGSFVTQPQPHWREGDLGSINYLSRGPHWSTGGFGLSYLAGNKKLAILGRKDSVFAANPPIELKGALAAFKQKNFKAAFQLSRQQAASPNPRVVELAEQLMQISILNRQSVDLTLADMKKTHSAGDLAKLNSQLQAIESILDPNDSRLSTFRSALEAPGASKIVSNGREFYRFYSRVDFDGEKGFRHFTAPGHHSRIQSLAAEASSSSALSDPYATIAKKIVAGLPKKIPTANVTLIKMKQGDSSQWKMSSENLPTDWFSPRFNDSRWEQAKTPVKGIEGTRAFRTTFEVEDPAAIDYLALQQMAGGMLRVYLNGTLIIHLEPERTRGRYERTVNLKPNTVELLKLGENTLAVVMDNTADRFKDFDLGLKVALKN